MTELIDHNVSFENGRAELSDKSYKDLLLRHSSDTIKHALDRMTEERLKMIMKDIVESHPIPKKEIIKTEPQPVKTSDHAPCMGLDGKCGSTHFNRTGTCFVCIDCGSSQGCS